jgi:hypothetical protein
MTPKKNIIKMSEKKKVVCKAFECQEEATTKGFCRVHYMMKLTGNASLFGGGQEDAEKERRKTNRLHTPTSLESDGPVERAPEEIVHTLTEIEGQTPTTIIDIEDLNPFKKTGS